MAQNVIVVRAKGARGPQGLAGAGVTPPVTTSLSSNNNNVLDQWQATEYTTLEYILQIKQGSKIRSSKIMIVTDHTLFYYTEYSIIELGGKINGLSIDAIKNGSSGQLTIQISDANTNNAQVTFVRTTIA